MKNYEQYKKSGLDLTLFGLEKGPARSGYFCTPIGARAVAWTGVDGIHYCLIRGFGEKVFVVNPMSTPGNYVHPVAESFEDFLRLLLACGGEAAVGRAHAWSRGRFEAFLRGGMPAVEKELGERYGLMPREKPEKPLQVDAALPGQTAAQKAWGEKHGLAPLEDPYGYIRGVQAAFDYRRLRFKKDYDEWAPAEPRVPAAPEWKVYFHGGFFERHGRERAGWEIAVGKTFRWGREDWCIPAVYACASGLVVDLCAAVDAEKVRDFTEKHRERGNDGPLSDEERWRSEAEDPLRFDFDARLSLNGQELEGCGGSGMTWVPPAEPEEEGWSYEARWVLEHYGLDETKAWSLHRYAFRWAGARRPALERFTLTLEPRPVKLCGARFKTPAAGESVSLFHPRTGAEYRLTAEETVQETLERAHLPEDDMEWPTHFTRMVYRITPDLPDEAFSIWDCAKGDAARQKLRAGRLWLPQAHGAVTIGIIGCADGPIALFPEGGPMGKLRMAASALRFEPADEIEWRIVFHEKERESRRVEVEITHMPWKSRK